MEIVKNRFRFIDLFAGIGGLRIPFEELGGQCVFSSEIDTFSRKTYSANFGETPDGDITKIDEKKIPDFDVLLAGFPCQPFSIAGERKGLEDERGNLFYDILRIVKKKKPSVILLENVKNLTTHDNSNTFKIITENLEDLGYKIKHKVLSALKHGNIPQNRERIYIACFLNEQDKDLFKFPQKKERTVFLPDVLEKNPLEKYFYKNKPLHEQLKKEVLNPNTSYLWRRKNEKIRENKNNVCFCLLASMGSGGNRVPIVLHDSEPRKITPRECARLQGFGEDFKIVVSDSQAYKQFGNSVCIPVVRAISKKLIPILNNKK